MKIQSILSFVVVIFLAGNLHAAVLVEYDFGADGDLGKTFAPTTGPLDGSASDITTNGSNGVISILSSSDTSLNNINNQGSADAAFNVLAASGYDTASDANRYFQFTLTPSDAYDLESIVFDVASGGASAPRNFRVEYSFDGFATAGILAGEGTSDPSTGSTMNFDRITYALTDESVNQTSSTVTFRFLGSTPSSTLQQIRYDNIMVNGTVVPEPSTALLLSFCGLGVLLLRRRCQV